MEPFLSLFTSTAPVLQALRGILQTDWWVLIALSETVPTAEREKPKASEK